MANRLYKKYIIEDDKEILKRIKNIFNVYEKNTRENSLKKFLKWKNKANLSTIILELKSINKISNQDMPTNNVNNNFNKNLKQTRNEDVLNSF